MPLYEYLCRNCENEFDKITRYGTKDIDITCPKCGKNEAKRKLSLFSFGTRSSSGHYHSSPAGGGGCADCAAGNCGNCTSCSH